jgi:hypothetical protein
VAVVKVEERANGDVTVLEITSEINGTEEIQFLAGSFVALSGDGVPY